MALLTAGQGGRGGAGNDNSGQDDGADGGSKDGKGGRSLAKPAFTEAESCVRAMYFAEHLGAQIYVPHISTLHLGFFC